MFLATTALSEFWDKEQDIVCLGSWCLPYSYRTEYRSFAYDVMPSPWDDRHRFYRAIEYLDECGEYMLKHLAEYLDCVHGTKHDKRYWRILIGPWLFHYLHAIYDRYVHIVEAIDRYGDFHTLVLDPLSFRVPRNTRETVQAICDDLSNLQLFTQLLHGMGFRFPAKSVHSAPLKDSIGATDIGLKQLIGRGIRRMLGAIIRAHFGRDYVALFDLNCPLSFLLTLARKTGFRAVPCEVPVNQDSSIRNPVFDERRVGFERLPSRNEFERLFLLTLSYAFPVQFLEGYSSSREAVLKWSDSWPRVIVSAVNWYWSEPIKFLAAEASERGSRIVAVQHGGGYGTYRCSAFELHERRTADSFMVWGWGDSTSTECRNLPSPILSTMQGSYHGQHFVTQRRSILYLVTEHPRYLARFQSAPVGTQWEDYYTWIERFLEMLPDKIRGYVHVRHNGKLVNFGQSTRKRIADKYPDLHWDSEEKIYESMKKSRLVVVDHHATAFLEALTVNVPTILFWDPQRWEVRDDAHPYFDGLRKAGILWHSPEAAAAKLSWVYEDPWAWWGSESVQEIRLRFVNRYALGRSDWVSHWGTALEKELMTSPN